MRKRSPSAGNYRCEIRDDRRCRNPWPGRLLADKEAGDGATPTPSPTVDAARETLVTEAPGAPVALRLGRRASDAPREHGSAHPRHPIPVGPSTTQPKPDPQSRDHPAVPLPSLSPPQQLPSSYPLNFASQYQLTSCISPGNSMRATGKTTPNDTTIYPHRVSPFFAPPCLWPPARGIADKTPPGGPAAFHGGTKKGETLCG